MVQKVCRRHNSLRAVAVIGGACLIAAALVGAEASAFAATLDKGQTVAQVERMQRSRDRGPAPPVKENSALDPGAESTGEPSPGLTETERDWIAKNGAVRVANELDWPPFDFAEDGEPKGYSIDLIRAAAKRSGLALEFVNGISWSELFEKFVQGGIDVLPAVNLTPERAATMALTEGYAANPTVLVTHKDRVEIKSLAGLEGKRVAIVKGFAIADLLARRHPKIELILVGSVLDGLKAVSLKTADAFVEGLGIVSYVTEKNVIPNLRIVGEVSLAERKETVLYMGVLKKNAVLRDILQKGLDAIPKEEKNAIRRRWIAFAEADTLRTARISLSDRERAYLAEHASLSIGIDPAWPPFEFVDKEGRFSGISSGFVSAVEKALGVSMKPVPGLDWNAVMDGVKNGTVDVVSMVAPTPERRAFMNFTKPYAHFPAVIVTRADAPYVGHLDDLKGRKVAVIGGYAVEDYLRQNHPALHLVTVADMERLLRAVAAREVDAGIDNLAAISYTHEQLRMTDIKVAAPAGFTFDLAMGVRKDWPELVPILDKALDGLDDAERAAIKDRWISVRYDFGIDISTILVWAVPIGGGLSVVLLLIVFWNRRLNREIAERTRTERRLQFTQNAVDKAADVIVWFRPHDGKIEYANEAASERLGYSREELMVMEAFDIAVDLDQEKLTRLDCQLADGLPAITYDSRHRTKDGRIIDVEVSLSRAALDDRGVLIANVKDVTERRRAEAATRAEEEMRNRMAEAERFNRLALDRERRIVELKNEVNDLCAALNRPEPYGSDDDDPAQPAEAVGGAESAGDCEDGVSFAELIDLDRFQQLFEHFCRTIGVAAAIIDLEGKILAAARWQRACTQFHRQNEATCARCIESDTDLALNLQAGKEYSIYRCANGLTDCASPIVVDGRHIANVFIGQFLLAEPDLDFFAAQARAVGFDEAEYLAAIKEVPVIFEERLPAILGFLSNFARLAASQSMERRRAEKAEVAARQRALDIQREREAAMSLAEDAVQARAEISRYQEGLERLVGERTADLAAAEERGRLILDSAAEGIFGTDVDGKVMFVNQAALEMLGFSQEEVLGGRIHSLVHHSHGDGSPYPIEECPMWQAYSHARPCRVEDEVLWRKDGTSFPVEYTAVPIWKDGSVAGSVVTFLDITERRKAAQALETEQRLLQHILDTSPISIAFSTKGRIHFANPQFVETFGAKPGDTSPKLYVNSADREDIVGQLERDGVVRGREVKMFDRHGRERDMAITYLPITYEGEVGILGWLRDVTARKEAEERIHEKIDELETFHRLAVGRELRMIALKEEINRLRAELGLPARYEIVE